MELHNRPFRVIFIDTVGPISPPDGEYAYIAHAECPFTRWCWMHPLKANTDVEWARFLVENVFFDVCGFPSVLRSDRGPEFTGQVVHAVNKLLGIDHAFGASFHPESQGYVEGRHKSLNFILAAFARDNPGGMGKACEVGTVVLTSDSPCGPRRAKPVRDGHRHGASGTPHKRI